MQTEAQPKSTDQLIQEHTEDLSETAAQDSKYKKRAGTLWKVLAIVILCIWLYEKKSSTVWLPVADSQQMCVAISDWWGLKVQAYYPVWRKPTGETQEYSEQWCIKYPDNSWRVFYGGHGESRPYKYPHVAYSTYF